MLLLTGTPLCFNSNSEVTLLPLTGSQQLIKAQPPILPGLCNFRPSTYWPIATRNQLLSGQSGTLTNKEISRSGGRSPRPAAHKERQTLVEAEGAAAVAVTAVVCCSLSRIHCCRGFFFSTSKVRVEMQLNNPHGCFGMNTVEWQVWAGQRTMRVAGSMMSRQRDTACFVWMEGYGWRLLYVFIYLHTYLVTYFYFTFISIFLHNPSIKEMIMDTDHTVRAKQRVGLCNFSRRDLCLWMISQPSEAPQRPPGQAQL